MLGKSQFELSTLMLILYYLFLWFYHLMIGVQNASSTFKDIILQLCRQVTVWGWSISNV